MFAFKRFNTFISTIKISSSTTTALTSNPTAYSRKNINSTNFNLSTLLARSALNSYIQVRTNVTDLRPHVVKVKKTFKGYFKLHEGGSLKGTVPQVGEYALIAEEGGRIKDLQIDAARTMIRRAIKPFKGSKFHLSTVPDTPFTSKGSESRMGKGKGAIDFWGVWVSKGQVLFEVMGLTEQAAQRALTVAGNALHIRTSVIKAPSADETRQENKVIPHFIKKRLDMQKFIADGEKLSK